jgi:hypothetical protein
MGLFSTNQPFSGEHGTPSNTPHFQASMCIANFIFWGSLTLIKLLHKPSHLQAHIIKCSLQTAAAILSMFPLFSSSDFSVLVLSVAINAVAVGGIFAVNFWLDGELAVEETVATPRYDPQQQKDTKDMRHRQTVRSSLHAPPL